MLTAKSSLSSITKTISYHHHLPTSILPSPTPTSTLPHSSIHPSHQSTNPHLISYINPLHPPPFSNHSILTANHSTLAAKSQILDSSSISSHSCFRIVRSSDVALGKREEGNRGIRSMHPSPSLTFPIQPPLSRSQATASRPIPSVNRLSEDYIQGCGGSLT